jgi:hypothetical protein
VASLDRAQSLQSAQRLNDARGEYLACSAESCPEMLREDCARSLLALELAMPTLVFSAEVDGHDASDVTVYLDGEILGSALLGRAIVTDPGVHVVRFVRRGSAPFETKVVAREGEKNRLVRASFASPLPAIKPAKAEGKRTHVLPLMLGGTGVVALGSALALRLTADARARELRATCAPACDPSERAALSDKLVLSNVALGVGIGALALAAATWIFDSKR